MATGSLAIKTETKNSETPHDLAVTEPREAAQSGPHDDHEIVALLAGRQGGSPFPLAAGLNELTGHVPCNLQGLSDGSALSDQPRKLFGSSNIHTFREQLNMNLNREFHLQSRVA